MFKIALKSTIITILSIMIFSIISLIFNINNKFLSLTQLFLFGGGIYLSHYFYKKEENYLNYKNAFLLGFLNTIFITIFYGITIFSSFKTNENKLLSAIKDNITFSLKDKNLPDKQIEFFMNKVNQYLTPLNTVLFICSIVFFIGILLSGLISIFTKEKNE